LTNLFAYVKLAFFLWLDSPTGPRTLTVESSRSHSDTPHSVGLLWTSDQPDADNTTWQHRTLTRHSHATGGNGARNLARQWPLNHVLDLAATGLELAYMFQYWNIYSYPGAFKSLAWPGKKQATATTLFLQATQKQFIRLSAQPGLRGSNDLRVGRKMTIFQLFFSSVGSG